MARIRMSLVVGNIGCVTVNRFDAHQVVGDVVEHRIGRCDAEVAVGLLLILFLLLLLAAVGVLGLALLPEPPSLVEVGDDLSRGKVCILTGLQSNVNFNRISG